jgi:hypothetical protein
MDIPNSAFMSAPKTYVVRGTFLIVTYSVLFHKICRDPFHRQGRVFSQFVGIGNDQEYFRIVGKIPPRVWENCQKNSGMFGKKGGGIHAGIIMQAIRT